MVDGFRTLFHDDHFPPRLVLNAFDSMGRTAAWDQFSKFLAKFFYKHYNESAEDGSTYQAISCFTHCSHKRLLHVEGISNYFDKKNLNYDLSSFTSVTMVPLKQSEGSELINQFLFFVPAFVWGFNELKKALIDDDIRLDKLYTDLNEVKQMIIESGVEISPPVDPPTLKETSFFFESGTGFGSRKVDFWRQVFRDSEVIAAGKATAGSSKVSFIGVPNVLKKRQGSHKSDSRKRPHGGSEISMNEGGAGRADHTPKHSKIAGELSKTRFSLRL